MVFVKPEVGCRFRCPEMSMGETDGVLRSTANAPIPSIPSSDVVVENSLSHVYPVRTALHLPCAFSNYDEIHPQLVFADSLSVVFGIC